MKLFRVLFACVSACFLPVGAHAVGGFIEGLSLAPFVPLVLDTMMSVAMAGYAFFVGDGGGVIYILVWGWLAITICLYLVKLFFPSKWLEMFGLKGNDALIKGELTGFKIGEELLKPGIRAVFAVIVLLQIRPQYMTRFIVDPFLQFGNIYTSGISQIIQDQHPRFGTPPDADCPDWLIEKGYISENGCRFMVQPVMTITHANHFMIKRGVELVGQGLGKLGVMSIIVRGPVEGILDIITGIILVMTFLSSSFFMTLLIIQGIFHFGFALMLYPFKVLTYVAKESKSWFDPWPAFDGIIGALKQLVITMIAAMVMMAINIAVLSALLDWDGGMLESGAAGFGRHSMTWLSAILTLIIMSHVFKFTREQLVGYAKGVQGGDKNIDELYNKVTSDAKALWNNSASFVKKMGKIAGGKKA